MSILRKAAYILLIIFSNLVMTFVTINKLMV